MRSPHMAGPAPSGTPPAVRSVAGPDDLPPALMLQGTCSNAGKSLLTAALCRLLARRGLRVVPFKAQNMALNSFVTHDGKEMGRAQALQAAACGLPADVRMNPVLLKPTSHTGSQVIVLGEPVGQMRVGAYLRYKPEAWKAVRRAYRSLASGADVVVLEGAGSPAEINLKAHDIVNMRMARYARAHVALVADIDRGGAFAALAGTMTLLTRAERARVAGFILNKFRGDPGLLDPALHMLTRRTGKPFWGVVPMLENLRLPEEDSVSFKLGITPGLDMAGMKGMDGGAAAAGGVLDVLVPDLPHISNATDLDALRQEHGLRVRIVRRAEDWGQPHAVILPGSRNTAADLRFLRATGLADAIVLFARTAMERQRGVLAGICGGLQMLGRVIADPLGLEEGGQEPGLDLLPLATRLEAAKQLLRVSGRACRCLTAVLPKGEIPGETGALLPAQEVAGYEIHHGRTLPLAGQEADAGGPGLRVVMADTAGRPLGWGLCDAAGRARVWGSYMHGLFDADAFRHAFLAALRQDAGLAPLAGASYGLGPELDRLADTVEASLDMQAIYGLLGLC